MTKLFAVRSALLEALCSADLRHWPCNSDFVVTIAAIRLATIAGRMYLNLIVLGHQAKWCIPIYLDLQEAIGTVHPKVDSLDGILFEN